MKEDKDETSGQENNASTSCYKNHENMNSAKSLFRVQKVKNHTTDKNKMPGIFRENYIYSSTSKTEPHVYLNEVDEPREKYKVISKASIMKKGKLFSTPSFLMKECWKADEAPMKLIELFKEANQEEDTEDEDEDDIHHIPIKRMRINLGEPMGNEKLSYTQEFHVLTEVQKAKILNVIEDTIKKLGPYGLNDKWGGGHLHPKDIEDNQTNISNGGNVDRYFCKKFLLPWVFMKVLEMVFCHLIQITFLSNNSFYDRKSEFLPVIVTFYLTLLIVVISLILHVSCYSCIGVQNPCYFMGVISSSVITLTTASGIFVLLCSMEFYNSFREILVLLLISGLLGTLMAELCLFYVEVKNFWSMIGTTDQYYIP